MALLSAEHWPVCAHGCRSSHALRIWLRVAVRLAFGWLCSPLPSPACYISYRYVRHTVLDLHRSVQNLCRRSYGGPSGLTLCSRFAVSSESKVAVEPIAPIVAMPHRPHGKSTRRVLFSSLQLSSALFGQFMVSIQLEAHLS